MKMTDAVHIIDIERILLDGVDRLRPGELTVMIEAEVRRLLGGRGVSESIRVAGIEGRVAAAVGEAVTHSLQQSERVGTPTDG